MENHEMETDDNNNEYMMKTNFESSIVNGVVNDGKLTLESLDFGHFLSILDHLDANSLMELCKVNDQFRNKVFFYKHILGSKLFEIDEFVDLHPIFTDYGQFIRKLDVNEYNIPHTKQSAKFTRLLESIVAHLVPGNLTELTLRFGVTKIDKDLLASALPFFVNLKHFAFNACGSDDYATAQELVLTEIIGNASKLTSLDVRYVRTAGKWFRFKHLINLKSLTFLFVSLTRYFDFRQFIQSRPALKSLIMSTESVHHQHLCRLITRYIPNLERFEIRNTYLELPHADDFDFSYVPWKNKKDRTQPMEEDDDDEDDNEDGDSDGEDDENGDETDDAETSDSDTDSEMEFESEESDSDIDDVRHPAFNANTDHVASWKMIYGGLNGMHFLKRSWLKSHFTNCIDLYGILKDMAEKNSIEHLTIQVSTLDHDFIQKDDFFAEPFSPDFTSLKTLRLVSPSADTQPFIRHFVQSLPNMTKCVLDSDQIDFYVQDTITTIVEASNSLESLVLKMPSMNLEPFLYMKLIGIEYCKAKRSIGVKPLKIYINSWPQKSKCLDQLKDYYDESVIGIKIKSFMNWEFDDTLK